ncbi:hypothetical protein FGO68_gene4288 [Halteria grandinella]|uniref:Uncharacterized protein n=1 Tax=Halteria grandinella TaxID=5974 RepID=A0A8J8NZ33_HALGN|nr:hypothetical protein FGO68_gene4288 [Halteria grandinella]
MARLSIDDIIGRRSLTEMQPQSRKRHTQILGGDISTNSQNLVFNSENKLTGAFRTSQIGAHGHMMSNLLQTQTKQND